jgi:hypothetical protein
MRVKEIYLLRQLGVLEDSISIFILGTIYLTEGVDPRFSLGVDSSTRTLVLICVTFGWYLLPADTVVDLRYPFGFNNISGSDTVVVC